MAGENVRAAIPSNSCHSRIHLVCSFLMLCGRRALCIKLRERLEREERRNQAMAGPCGSGRRCRLVEIKFLVIVMTPAARSKTSKKEWRYAGQRGINVDPVSKLRWSRVVDHPACLLDDCTCR